MPIVLLFSAIGRSHLGNPGLEFAGMSYSDLVKMDAYLVGLEYYDEYVDLLREILGEAKPASKAVIVPALVLPGLLIEIEVVAAKS